MTLDRDQAALAILQTLLSTAQDDYDKSMPAKAVAIADDLVNAIWAADQSDQHGKPIIGTGKPSKLGQDVMAGAVSLGSTGPEPKAPAWDENAAALPSHDGE